MNEIITELSEDEAACLLIMKEGQPLVDLGEYSKWHGPLLSLVRRGMCRAISQFNNGAEYAITQSGRDAIEAWDNQSIRDVINASNAVAGQRKIIPLDAPKILGLSSRQIEALAQFYRNTTGRNPQEICEP